uniref:Uncharacterized protein n=1 Tax=Lepeophtheirus salmonis TaxID=72036 RepID=A0A0K2URT3_LEPSM
MNVHHPCLLNKDYFRFVFLLTNERILHFYTQNSFYQLEAL